MQPMLLQTSEETDFTMKKIAVDKVAAEEIREFISKEEVTYGSLRMSLCLPML